MARLTARQDLQRILNIPRRKLAKTLPKNFGDDLRLCGGDWQHMLSQRAMLFEAQQTAGLIAEVTMGAGKTLATLQIPLMFAPPEDDTRSAVLFTRPALVEKTIREAVDDYRPRFEIYEDLEVLPYSLLSHRDYDGILEEFRPWLLIFDEAHSLANKDSVRAIRVNRWLQEYPDTIVCALSGTFLKSSQRDCAHIYAWALGDDSPLPLTWDLLAAFCACADESTFVLPSARDWALVQPLVSKFHPRANTRVDVKGPTIREKRRLFREALAQRFRSCPGVVVSSELSSNKQLHIHTLGPDSVRVPKSVRNALKALQDKWIRPDEQLIEDPLSLARTGLQLSRGFYLYWEWGTDGPDYEWLDARKAWAQTVSEVTRKRQRGTETAAGVVRAMTATLRYLAMLLLPSQQHTRCTIETMFRALRRSKHFQWYPPLYETFAAWQAQMRRREPPSTVCCWMSSFVLDDAIARAERLEKRGTPPIIFYANTAVADALERRGIEVVRPGDDPNETDERLVAMSLRSHGIGRNLQAWATMIVLCPPAGGDTIEQLFARVNRTGQARQCLVILYSHTPQLKQTIETAYRRCVAVQQAKHQPQQILQARWTGDGYRPHNKRNNRER